MKDKLLNIVIAILIFITIFSTVTYFTTTYHSKKELLAAVNSLQEELEKVSEENRIHEEEEIKTGLIEHYFSAIGQVRIELGYYKLFNKNGCAVIEDTKGHQWTVRDLSTELYSSDELLLFIDNANTPEDIEDDTVVGVYINAQAALEDINYDQESEE